MFYVLFYSLFAIQVLDLLAKIKGTEHRKLNSLCCVQRTHTQYFFCSCVALGTYS